MGCGCFERIVAAIGGSCFSCWGLSWMEFEEVGRSGGRGCLVEGGLRYLACLCSIKGLNIGW
jgi:hypothetical protein